MKKKILLLGSLSIEPGEDVAVKNMAQYVQSSVNSSTNSYEVSYCHMDELGFVANNESVAIQDLRNNRPLSDYQLVFFRGKLKGPMNDVALVSYYLHELGITSINSAYANRRATGKVAQMFQLHDLGIPIPYSVSASAKYLPALIREHLTHPLVVKDSHGVHGNINFLVHSDKELEQILAAHPTVSFIAQEYIPNDSDYRILIAGPRELIIQRKASGSSHLNNTSQGGTATLIARKDFSSDIIAQARQFAAFCKYELAGVDVMFHRDTGEHYFLEINSQPQIVSGAFVEEKSQVVGKFFRDLLSAD